MCDWEQRNRFSAGTVIRNIPQRMPPIIQARLQTDLTLVTTWLHLTAVRWSVPSQAGASASLTSCTRPIDQPWGPFLLRPSVRVRIKKDGGQYIDFMPPLLPSRLAYAAVSTPTPPPRRKSRMDRTNTLRSADSYTEVPPKLKHIRRPIDSSGELLINRKIILGGLQTIETDQHSRFLQIIHYTFARVVCSPWSSQVHVNTILHYKDLFEVSKSFYTDPPNSFLKEREVFWNIQQS